MAGIIIADDHELIREAVKPYLSQLAEKVSIFEAGTYGEVLDCLVSLEKQEEDLLLILLDLDMPGKADHDQFQGLRRVKQAAGQTPVVIFSGDENPATVSAALQNGARGFVPKTMRGKSLVNALRLILAGDVYVPPMIANASAAPAPAQKGSLAGLSARELESLRMLVKGMTNKEIARELGVQDVTVKLHLRNAYRKIGANNRVEAVRIAVQQQLG